MTINQNENNQEFQKNQNYDHQSLNQNQEQFFLDKAQPTLTEAIGATGGSICYGELAKLNFCNYDL